MSPADRLRQWVEALESGRYRQGRARLRNGDKFCCLGVACDLANPEGWGYDWMPWAGLPPAPVLNEFGLDRGEASVYATENDAGQTFKQIAAQIRANHKEVFDA